MRLLNKGDWLCILALAVFTALNGIFQQADVPFVDSELNAIVTQLSAPVTWIGAFVMFGGRFTVFQVPAFGLMMFGLLFGGLFSYFTDLELVTHT